MRILVCGGRKFNDWELLRNTLDRMFLIWDDQPFPHLPEGFEVIQGGAFGADDLADQWSHLHGVASQEYAADWSLGKAAGYIRNKRMLEEGKPDLVIAFPGGKGTANMVKLAREAGVEVREVVK